MDDELRDPASVDRIHARTSERVAQMSDEERAELARELARRKQGVADVGFRRAGAQDSPAPYGPAAPALDDDKAAAAARIVAELRSTERRLDRLERSATPTRYQGGPASPPTGHYDRLLSRAARLERKLRDLR